MIAPFFLPYMRMQEATGFQRTLSGQYSANIGAWLNSSAWAHRWWAPYLQTIRAKAFFPGILAIVLGRHSERRCVLRTVRRSCPGGSTNDRSRRRVVLHRPRVVHAVADVWPRRRSLHAALLHGAGVLVPARPVARRHRRHAVPGRARGAGDDRVDAAARRQSRRSRSCSSLAVADLYRAPLRMREAPPLPAAYRDAGAIAERCRRSSCRTGRRASSSTGTRNTC